MDEITQNIKPRQIKWKPVLILEVSFLVEAKTEIR